VDSARAVIRKMAASWPRRATLRSDLYSFEGARYDDPQLPDYPLALVPFARHPSFTAADPALQRAVLTWGWISYNERTVDVEEHLANPAFTLIMHDAFDGATDIDLRKSIQHCLIDEHFHTLMHMAAIDDTRRLRGIVDVLALPPSIPVRRLREYAELAGETWEVPFIRLAFGVVAEVTVKGFLSLLADDETIQPDHRTVARLHNRDEYAHGQVLAEVAKILWERMGARQRGVFTRALAPAVESFVAQDFAAWRSILEHLRFPDREAILAESAGSSGGRSLLRDVSSVAALARELGIYDQVAGAFPG
jgi:hypothetical protein